MGDRPNADQFFVRLPLVVDQALARRGTAEERVLRVICRFFYHGGNGGERAVKIPYSRFEELTRLARSQISEAIRSLESRRMIQVSRDGKRCTSYASTAGDMAGDAKAPAHWSVGSPASPSPPASPRNW